MSNKEKIVIAGATSSVGKCLIKELNPYYDLITMGRRNADIFLELQENIENIEFPEGDTLIILTAAVKTESNNDIVRLFDINVQGTLKLCIKAKEKGIKKIIYVSSIYALLEIEDAYYGYYSISKKNTENIIEYFCRQNSISLCILRPSQIYGDSFDFSKNQPLIYKMLENAYKGEDIKIYGNNNALRNYIYISDIIMVIRGVIEKGITGVHNVISPKNIRLAELAEIIIREFNSPSNIVFCRDMSSIIDNPFYDVGDIYSLLNINRLTSIEDGICNIKRNLYHVTDKG